MKKDKTNEEKIAELWADIEVAGHHVYQATILGNARNEQDQVDLLRSRINSLQSLVYGLEKAYDKI